MSVHSLATLRVVAVLGALLAAALLAPGATSAQTPPGETAEATVSADGDCLRLRAAPSIEADVLTCLPDGTVVTLLGEEVEADGERWQALALDPDATSAGGWAAASYLVPVEAPAESVGPVLPTVEAPVLLSAPLLTPISGGFTQGTTTAGDPAALVAAQPFEVESVWRFLPATQEWLRYIPGAPARVNTLGADDLPVDSIVMIRRRGELDPSSLADPPAAPAGTLVEGVAHVLAPPPSGALTQGVAGTNDPAALVAAQLFEVRTVSMFHVASQQWLVFIPGAPAAVNTLHRGLLRGDRVVTVRAGAVSPALSSSAGVPDELLPTATPSPTPAASATAEPTATTTPEAASPTIEPTSDPTTEPTATAEASPTPLAGGTLVEATLTYYFCLQGSIAAGIGDGGGFCGFTASGEPVHGGGSSCAAAFLGQRFMIQGDPTGRVYTCNDTGPAVVGQHRDVWFESSDDGYLWWQAVGPVALIEILPE